MQLPSKRIMLAAVTASALAAAGLASASPFIQLGPHKSPPPQADQAPADLVLKLDEPTARHKIEAVMSAEGFEPSDAGRTPSQISYVKFGDVAGFHSVADCQGLGVGTPKLWIETLILDVRPETAGVRVLVTGQFQVVLSGLISGKPFKLVCRSHGVLETQIREALSKD